MSHQVKAISREEHVRFAASRPSVSHLQLPSWAGVKPDWRAESLGWFDERGDLVGAGLALLRPLPGLRRRCLAYLPEGPVIDWSAPDLEGWLEPMLAHLHRRGAFSVRMGPPVVTRRWDTQAVKAAIADPRVRRLGDVEATARDTEALAVADRLRRAGWRPAGSGGEGGFAVGQPRYVCQVPLAGRSPEQIQAGFNQQWRRNVKKAERAGVRVVQGKGEDLPVFYDLYAETAERDRFTPRPAAYFQRMWTALNTEHQGRMRLYLAHHDGEVLAAATMLTVGDHVWYSYGASTSRRREVQASTAVQWRMIRDARDGGARVYDFRGITDTLDENDPLVGLLRFKVGAGGEAVEYLGEWERPLNRVLHKALSLYLSWR